ncbi:hypothetical protein [Eubacterium aggregans]|uniref:hypothetical protein n=1 Tax=Eubacterium aggregans TaxID=81409 RepID=UPI003F3A5391
MATGSKRRIYQLKALRPDLEIVGIRGNIDTRIRKMQEQGLDGIILAAAGMRRIGVYDAPEYHVVPLNPSTFFCAPAQGILAVEIREDNEEVKALMATVCDERTRVQMEAERGFLVVLNGDCHIPIGAYCELAEDGSICLHGLYGTDDGSRLVADILTGDARQAAEIGNQLAIAMKGQVDG